MIVDIHAHTSNRPLYGLHTTDASIGAIEKLAAQYDVRKVFLLATYFPFKGRGVHNRDLLGRIGQRELFGAFGSLDVMNDLGGGILELADLAGERLVTGVKLYPGYQNFGVSNPEMFLLYQMAADYGLPVMIHSGQLHHCCSDEDRAAGRLKCGSSFCYIDRLGHLAEPRSMELAISSCPDVDFILCHMGNPYFDQLEYLMNKYSNVFTDTSGQLKSGSGEDTQEYRKFLVRQMMRVLNTKFGRERVLFGTDFPIQSYNDSIGLIESLPISDADRQLIYWGNANRLLNLCLRSVPTK
ncbi:MAG: amidohydrolase family protein [Candidatus Paceibacterota bacterium]|jgi:hypothetical protein